MSYHFDTLIDTPDVTLKPQQWLILKYSYTWGSLVRTRTFRRAIPLQMHLKDLLKMRELGLQQLCMRQRQLIGGPEPHLFGLHVLIVDTVAS